MGPLFSGNSTSGTLLEMFFIKGHANGTKEKGNGSPNPIRNKLEYWEEDIFRKKKKLYRLKLLHLYLICKVVKVLLHLKLTLLCL